MPLDSTCSLPHTLLYMHTPHTLKIMNQPTVYNQVETTMCALITFYPVSFMLPKFPDTTWLSMNFGLTLSNSHQVHNDCKKYLTPVQHRYKRRFNMLLAQLTFDLMTLLHNLRIHVIYNPATSNPCIQT